MWLEIPDEFIKKSLMASGAQDRKSSKLEESLNDRARFPWKICMGLLLSRTAICWTRLGSRVVFGKGSEDQANEMGDFLSESVSGAEIADKIRVVEIIERINYFCDDRKLEWTLIPKVRQKYPNSREVSTQEKDAKKIKLFDN